MAFFLIKNKSGQYSPVDESDFEQSKGVGVGNVVKCTASRNVKFHRKGMALLKIGFDNQDMYDSFEVYRKVITIKAGFCQLVMLNDSRRNFIPDSISFENMSAEKFERWYNATLDIIYTEIGTTKEELIKEVEQFI